MHDRLRSLHTSQCQLQAKQITSCFSLYALIRHSEVRGSSGQFQRVRVSQISQIWISMDFGICRGSWNKAATCNWKDCAWDLCIEENKADPKIQEIQFLPKTYCSFKPRDGTDNIWHNGSRGHQDPSVPEALHQQSSYVAPLLSHWIWKRKGKQKSKCGGEEWTYSVRLLINHSSSYFSTIPVFLFNAREWKKEEPWRLVGGDRWLC